MLEMRLSQKSIVWFWRPSHFCLKIGVASPLLQQQRDCLKNCLNLKAGFSTKVRLREFALISSPLKASGNFINKMENLAIPHDCLEKDNKLLEQYSIALGLGSNEFSVPIHAL